VESHGGKIDIGANPDGPGTTVTFSFPPNGAHGLS
jgi:signal transduction histidine kinase